MICRTEKNLNCQLCNCKNLLKNEWLEYLSSEFDTLYMIKIIKYLHSSKFYPPINSIFTFTHFFKPLETKIIILGQDPYHNTGQAMGLAFSVPETAKIPPSLRNIFNEIKSCYPNYVIPNHGNLSAWAQQGVLLLNSGLSVEINQPNSHAKIGWSQFTDKIISKISEDCKNCVFMLWGNFAIKKKNMIDKDRHLVLEAPHPSPFSAMKGFMGCGHFKTANEYLIANGKSPIDWYL